MLCVGAWRRRCLYERGEEHPRCQFYQKAYQSLCPSEWVSTPALSLLSSAWRTMVWAHQRCTAGRSKGPGGRLWDPRLGSWAQPTASALP